mgnify:CR=1 FL=1
MLVKAEPSQLAIELLSVLGSGEKTILDAYATILVPHKLFDDAVRLLRTEFSIKSRVQTATIGETQDD